MESAHHVALRQRLWLTSLRRYLASHELATSWARTHELRRELHEAIDWAQRERRRSRWLRRTGRPLPRVVRGK